MSTLRLVPAIGSPIEVKHDTLVGRDPGAGVHLPDVSVSRKHARLVRRAEEWAVVDQGSANGTYVDGVQIDDAALRNGQEVRFGNITYRVELEVQEQPQALDNDDDLSPTVFQFKAPPPPAIAPMAARPAAPPPPPAEVPPPPGARTQTIPPGTMATPDEEAPPQVVPPPLPPPAPVAAPVSIPMVPAPAAPAPPASLPPGMPVAPGAPGWVEPSARPAPVRRPPAQPAAAAAAPPPRAKRSSGALMWILGGTLGCFALLVLLIGVAIGIPFLVSKGATDAVHAQVAAIKQRQYAQAYAGFDAAFQKRISQQDFERYVAATPVLAENTEALLPPPSGSVHIQNDRGTVTGVLVGPGGARQDATWQIVKVGDAWKIADLTVGGQSPSPAPVPEDVEPESTPSEEPASN